MSPKILIIFEYQTLFEILDEIHKSLNFKMINCNKNEYKNIYYAFIVWNTLYGYFLKK